MSSSKIIILKDAVPKSELKSTNNSTIITFDELKGWVTSGSILKRLFKYRGAELVSYRLGVIPKPLVTALLLRALSLGPCYFEDEKGQRVAITTSMLAKLSLQLIKDYARKSAFISQIGKEAGELTAKINAGIAKKHLDLSLPPVYLRTDLVFGLRSGGSVGHIAGVLNNLDTFTGHPIFLTTDTIPTVRDDFESHVIFPTEDFWGFREIPTFSFNHKFINDSQAILKNKRLSFVYQRYSLNNFAGVTLAQTHNVPFVLEYNGSEIWINRNWDRPLKYESLSEKIELLNLNFADVIVVVSQPMKDELVGRGIDPEKILVNPNGVNPEKYSPEADGSGVRAAYGFNDKLVIGFIGTFGRWHGAEVLAEAFGRLVQQHPEYREKVRLLMIGDGVTMSQVKENLQRYGVMDITTLTGIIPQEEGPTHLAACDILASPHVPNLDGTPFFGSPTKLFEYMAMGKGIVASDLDQIGEILEHDKTAWMVKPGDVDSLVDGLMTLIGDKDLRERLGKAAREEVVAKYTWKEHTRKIIEKLKARCG